MIGIWNVNYDKKTISYDFNVKIELFADIILTRSHLDQSIKHLDETKKEFTTATTNQLTGLHLRDISFDGLGELIEKVELFLVDLKELKDKSETPPAN